MEDDVICLGETPKPPPVVIDLTEPAMDELQTKPAMDEEKRELLSVLDCFRYERDSVVIGEDRESSTSIASMRTLLHPHLPGSPVTIRARVKLNRLARALERIVRRLDRTSIAARGLSLRV